MEKDMSQVVMALVNRLGGEVSLTESEVLGLDPSSELVIREPNTFQDDLLYLKVRVRGSDCE